MQWYLHLDSLLSFQAQNAFKSLSQLLYKLTSFPNYPISANKTITLLTASLGGKFDLSVFPLSLASNLSSSSVTSFFKMSLWNSHFLGWGRFSDHSISRSCFCPFFTFLFPPFHTFYLLHGSLLISSLLNFSLSYLVTTSQFDNDLFNYFIYVHFISSARLHGL